MKHIPYNEQKKKYDYAVMSYIAKRIFTDIDDTPAFNAGVIDSFGNMRKDPVGWEFTNLDRFVLAIKQQIGEENLRDLLEVYSDHADINDFRLMRTMDKPFIPSEMDSLKKIVSTMESLAYLAEGRDDSYIDDENVDHCGFDGRVSNALTLATFLLYAMKLERMPTSVEFFTTIIPSVEVTFYHSANNDYDQLKEFIQKNKLMDEKSLATRAVRALVSAATSMLDGGLLTMDGSRIEDQSRSWEKLGTRRNAR